MFGFLKDKLKSALGKFTKEVEKDSVSEEVKTEVETKKVSKETVKEKVAQKVQEPNKKDLFDEKISKDKKTVISVEKNKKEEPISKVPESKKDKKHVEEHKKEKPVHKVESKKIEEKVPEKKDSHTTIIEPKKEEPKKSFLSKIFGKKEEKTSENKSTETDTTLDTEKIIEEPKTIIKEKKPEIITEVETIKDNKDNDEKVSISKKSETKHKEPEKHKIVDKAPDKKVSEPRVEEPTGFFSKITETFTKFNLSEEKFEEIFWELELAMLENNVAVEVIDKIKLDLKKELMSGKISRKNVDELISSTLKNSIEELFDVEKRDLIAEIKSKKNKPYIITIIGVNGSGKTTSIAKLTNLLKKNNLTVVLAASDTFRAAAIQQIEEHANKLDVKLIKHDYNSDPAAVAFDAIKYSEAKGVDVVIVDTAGRLHSNTNLMRELEKVVRVCKPDIKIFVGESITGNDCVEQAKEFDKLVGIDAIILAKADVDEKGGAAISVSYVTRKPILYLGTGQTYDDLKEFDPKLILENLEL